MLSMKFIVSGKVQGVWFRASTQSKANELNITGYAKNLANGDVEVIACGEESALKQLEAWLWHGPDLAKVEHIEQEVIESTNFNNFSVL